MFKREVAQYIIIVGCGRLGSYIANSYSKNHQAYLVIIDEDKEAFSRLDPSFSGFTMEGSGTDIEMLKKAKIEEANILIATTENDNKNYMISRMGKEIFQVPLVYSRLVDQSKKIIYDELNIEIISPTELAFEKMDTIIINNR